MLPRTIHQNSKTEIHIIESEDNEGIIIDVYDNKQNLFKTITIWYDDLEVK